MKILQTASTLIVFAAGGGCLLYSWNVKLAEDKNIQKQLYVRSWIDINESRRPDNSVQIAVTFGAGTLVTAIGVFKLWKDTRELNQDESSVDAMYPIVSTEGQFPPLISSAIAPELIPEIASPNDNSDQWEVLTEPPLTEVERDVLEYCQKQDPIYDVPASALQRSKYGAVKSLGAEDIRSVFMALQTKGYGTCIGTGRKMTFLVSQESA